MYFSHVAQQSHLPLDARGPLQRRMPWERFVCIAFRKPEKRNIWCRMKSLQVSCSFLTVIDGSVYHQISSFASVEPDRCLVSHYSA